MNPPASSPAESSPWDYLTVGQMAEYLGWSPRIIEGLVRGERLPALEFEGQVRFRRGEVIDWLEQKIQTLESPRVSELEAKLEADLMARGIFRTGRIDRLTSRLPVEGIAVGVAASTKADVLRNLAELARRTGLLHDRDLLLASLIDRESLCSTAQADGLALCHPRRPLQSAIEREFLCFLRTAEPVDFGAEDGRPTDLFFLLCAPDDRSHLHGLARLARILRSDVIDGLRSADTPGEIHRFLVSREESTGRPVGSSPGE